MTELIVGFTIDGYHCWPDSPDKYSEFKQRHRHLFRFICWVPCKVEKESDRPIELFELRRIALALVTYEIGKKEFEPVDFKDLSCEGMAQKLKKLLDDHYRVRTSKVFVGEDDNFGAMVS